MRFEFKKNDGCIYRINVNKYKNKATLGFAAIEVVEDTEEKKLLAFYKDMTVIKGRNGIFLSEPSKQGKDGKYYSTYLLPRKLKEQALTKEVIKFLEESESTGSDIH